MGKGKKKEEKRPEKAEEKQETAPQEVEKELSPQEKAVALLTAHLEIEKEMVRRYNKFLVHFKNQEIREDLSRVRDEEEAHVELVEEAISLIK